MIDPRSSDVLLAFTAASVVLGILVLLVALLVPREEPIALAMVEAETLVAKQSAAAAASTAAPAQPEYGRVTLPPEPEVAPPPVVAAVMAPVVQPPATVKPGFATAVAAAEEALERDGGRHIAGVVRHLPTETAEFDQPQSVYASVGSHSIKASDPSTIFGEDTETMIPQIENGRSHSPFVPLASSIERTSNWSIEQISEPPLRTGGPSYHQPLEPDIQAPPPRYAQPEVAQQAIAKPAADAIAEVQQHVAPPVQSAVIDTPTVMNGTVEDTSSILMPSNASPATNASQISPSQGLAGFEEAVLVPPGEADSETRVGPPPHVIERRITWPVLVDDTAVDVDLTTRLKLIEALGFIGGSWSIEILARAYEQELDAGVRGAIFVALRDSRSAA